jgi:hypothetical protein
MKKGLVVGVIALLVGVSVLSSVSSKDISVSDEEMLEYDIELEDNNEIEPLDNYDEIVSYISGRAFFDNYPPTFCWDEHIICYDWVGEDIHIRAITRTPGHRFYTANASYLDAEHFYGLLTPWPNYWLYSITGIALGNIEWS